MKIKELIENLQKYNPEMEVLTYEGEEPVVTLVNVDSSNGFDKIVEIG